MKNFSQTFGSALQVFNGTAKKTNGGLTKKDLKKTKRGNIVSKKKSKLGSKPNEYMRLKEKARKSDAPMFEYNGKKYYKNKLPTGMVIYSRKKPSKMLGGGSGCRYSGGAGCGGPHTGSHKKKSGGAGCGGPHKKKSGGFTLRKSTGKSASKSKSKSMKKPKFNKKFNKKFKKSGKVKK